MSDHEESFNTGYSTPVPELDDHRHQSSSVQKPRSRRGTVETMRSTGGPTQSPDLSLVNPGLYQVSARDFEEAVIDEETGGASPLPGREGVRDKSRRETVTTLDPRSISPPNSVKAFADARRRERQPSTSEAFGTEERHDAHEHSHHRTQSFGDASFKSYKSLRSRRFTNDNDDKSLTESIRSEAEEDVCFPLHATGNKNSLQIDFEMLEEFIAEEETREKTPPKGQPQARIFQDLRAPKVKPPNIVMSNGDMVEIPSHGSSSLNEKEIENSSLEASLRNRSVDVNRFEFFSSVQENTIHAAEFGDLVLPGEDIRSLFSLPDGKDVQDSEGVWWLNLNNPTEEEIRAICKAFRIHPLTIEDIGTQEAREKIELFSNYYFACFRSFNVVQVEDGQEYEPHNIYVVVFREGTLSFSFSQNAHAAHVRKRIAMLKDYVALSSDWICYALIDDIVDCFAPIITRLDDETDAIEDAVFVARDHDMHTFLRKIGMIRKNVMAVMKIIGGKADVLKGFTKRCNENYKVTPRMDIGLYLGDIQDHVVTMMTSLGHFEKMLSRSHSNYLAQLSIDNLTQGNRANRVLSQITVIASILVPLNLVCGLFGMNVTVPWKEVEGTGPFFGILGCLVAFSVFCLVVARRFRFI